MIRLHEHTLTLLQRLLQRGEQPSAEDAREYSVDELARAAGSSVRNVRAYQDRGLLPPPGSAAGSACISTAISSACG